MQGVGAAHAPKRDLNPATARAPARQLDGGAQDEFRAAVTGPRPNRYDEVIDRLRLAALRRDAAAAAASQHREGEHADRRRRGRERRRREGGE